MKYQTLANKKEVSPYETKNFIHNTSGRKIRNEKK